MGHMGTQKKRIWLTVSTQKNKIRYDHRVSRNKQKTKKAVGLVWVFLHLHDFGEEKKSPLLVARP